MSIAVTPSPTATSAHGTAAERLFQAARRFLTSAPAVEGRGARSAAPTRARDLVDADVSGLEPDTYRVQLGDTAASIAIAHGLSAASLLVRNGMRLREEPAPGTCLIVERGEGGCREATTDVPVEVRRHTVCAGETVERLCVRFRISPRILLTANGMSSASCLTPGVTIVIPTSTNPNDTGEIPVIRASGCGVSADLS